MFHAILKGMLCCATTQAQQLVHQLYLLIFIQSQQFFGLDIIAGNVTNNAMLVFDFPPVFLRIIDHLVLRILIEYKGNWNYVSLIFLFIFH